MIDINNWELEISHMLDIAAAFFSLGVFSFEAVQI